jgi:hypothetical protein
VDNFSYVVGKHSLRMGGEYRYNKFPQVGNEFPRGQFLFEQPVYEHDYAYQRNRRHPDRRLRGRGLHDGYMNNAIAAVSLVQADFRSSEWAAYIDDSGKSPRA